MLASHDRRFLFIHVQKTGGSAIEQHPELAGFFTLGFVRNPWERFHSWHAMIMRRRDGARDGSYDA
ncbi:MAG: hypothetical protein ACJ72P_11385, partial [Nocardioides sp.]